MVDINELFSKGQSVASKVSSLKDAQLSSASLPGFDQLASSAKQGAMNLVSAWKKKDFPAASTATVAETAPPETVRVEQQETYQGVLTYPAQMKYYAKFSFKVYDRTNVAMLDPKVLPRVDIVLPIPSNLKEQFDGDYNAVELGTVGGALTNSVNDVMRSFQNGDDFGKIISDTWATLKAGTLPALVVAMGARSTQHAENAGRENGVAGGGATLGNAAKRITGMTPNPHLAILFNNMRLRSHDFGYLFAPNSQKELLLLKEIVRTLKKRMLPSFINGSSLLYGFPDLVDISFGPTPGTPYNIKTCVLSSLTVDWSPSQSPAFFRTGDSVAVAIRMSFTETQTFTRDDIPDGVSDKSVFDRHLDKANYG